jgi:hypothetical protein
LATMMARTLLVLSVVVWTRVVDVGAPGSCGDMIVASWALVHAPVSFVDSGVQDRKTDGAASGHPVTCRNGVPDSGCCEVAKREP